MTISGVLGSLGYLLCSIVGLIQYNNWVHVQYNMFSQHQSAVRLQRSKNENNWCHTEIYGVWLFSPPTVWPPHVFLLPDCPPFWLVHYLVCPPLLCATCIQLPPHGLTTENHDITSTMGQNQTCAHRIKKQAPYTLRHSCM